MWFAEPTGSGFVTAKMIHEKDAKFLKCSVLFCEASWLVMLEKTNLHHSLTLYSSSAIKISSRQHIVFNDVGAYSAVAQWQSIRLLTEGL